MTTALHGRDATLICCARCTGDFAQCDMRSTPGTSLIGAVASWHAQCQETKAAVAFIAGAAAFAVPRSYSDSDIQKLAIELDINEDRNIGVPVFSKDDMLDLSSNHSSTLSHLTSKSRASSFLAKSEVSSISGGSVHQVRLGTQPCLDEEGNQVSKATTEFRLSEYNELPVNEFGVRLSAASSQHQPGKRSRCRKCAFYNTFSMKRGKVCKNGALCDFCHDSHDRFIHRR